MLPAVVIASAPLAHCTFAGPPAKLIGSCHPVDAGTPSVVIGRVPAVTHGVWRTATRPDAVWTGRVETDGNKTFVQIETYAGGWGIFRSELSGWFPATHVSQTAGGLSFDVDFDREIPPNDLDRKIVRRAAAILSGTGVWNRADNRKCPASATSWSIYCAMQKATIEITGGFDHRRPAMELVRIIVEKRSEGKDYPHRLMGYNNDPSTAFSDVQSLFAEALRNSGDRAWLKEHGFTVEPPFFSPP